MPPPSWIDKINIVWTYYVNLCEAPGIVYIETAHRTSKPVVLAFLTYGYDDILRAVFRPKGVHHRRKGRKKRGKKSIPGVPEIPDLVADEVPWLDDWKKRPISDGGKLIWVLDGFIQRVIWEIAVIEIAGDWIYSTLLTIMRTDQAHCARGIRAMRANPSIAPTSFDRWESALLWDRKYEHGGIITGPVVTGLPPGRYFVTFSCRVRSGAASPKEAQIRLSFPGGAPEDNLYSSRVALDPGGEAGLIASGVVDGDRGIAYEIFSQTTEMFFTDLVFYCMKVEELI